MMLKKYAVVVLLTFCTAIQVQCDKAGIRKKTGNGIMLSSRHIEAVNRERRILLYYDIGWVAAFVAVNTDQLDEAINYYLSAFDEEPNQIDNICYNWTEGNIATWPSKILPLNPRIFPKWSDAGIDPVRVLMEETRKKGKEVFFNYRINGADNEPGITFVPPMKVEHPEWLHDPFPDLAQVHWNFAIQEVRDYKVSILRELAEMYDLDGIQIDFARNPVSFLQGHQWENRDFLTDFMREVRLMLLGVEEQRGRPFLLAAKVPENIMGCHFDGMDVESWARENLVDIFVLGCRSSDVDIASFRWITEGTGIKLYPSWDNHHASDGYHNAPVEVYRGVYANWWNQGADGVDTFNLSSHSPKAAARVGLPQIRLEDWERQCQIFREIGSPETLRYKDKVFFVQRRGGGHHVTVVPNIEDWNTPRHLYFNTNMFAPLPVTLHNDGKADALLTLTVADDMNVAAERIKEITLRMVLSDPAAADLPDTEKLKQIVVGELVYSAPDWCYRNIPPVKGIEKLIEVRINNILLDSAHVEEGWLVFPVQSRQLAVGDNLVGVRVTKRLPNVRDEIIVEKLELHVKYR